MEAAVLSLSGGMDSTSLLLHLLVRDFKVFAVSFNYGQKHGVELQRAKDNIAYLKKCGYPVQHTIIDLSILGSLFNSALTSPEINIPEGHYADDNMKATVVPNRNAIFASIVYGYALSLSKDYEETFIALGTHSGDHLVYPDCRPEFQDALEHAFKIGNWDSEKVSYYTPYINGDKFSILADAVDACDTLGVYFNHVFENTSTCYHPDALGRSCGKCGSCTERVEAFVKLGWPDPIQYQEPYGDIERRVLDVLNQKK
jgi:7-cyano-7-deazaguanine synthase